jgi:GGDEF domain-containing protein
MLVPDTDRAGALRLAERLEESAGTLRTSRGSRVAVAVGAASCPQDGRVAAALAAHADVGVYAARQARRAPGAGEPARS